MAVVLRVIAVLCLLRGISLIVLSFGSVLDQVFGLPMKPNWKLGWFIEQFGQRRGVRFFGAYNLVVGALGMWASFWF